jgi:hypothetical protein
VISRRRPTYNVFGRLLIFGGPPSDYLSFAAKKGHAMEPKVSHELYNIMDALAAIKMDLTCETHTPGETLVLSAAQARGACKALEAASASITKIRAVLQGKDAGDSGL